MREVQEFLCKPRDRLACQWYRSGWHIVWRNNKVKRKRILQDKSTIPTLMLAYIQSFSSFSDSCFLIFPLLLHLPFPLYSRNSATNDSEPWFSTSWEIFVLSSSDILTLFDLEGRVLRWLTLISSWGLENANRGRTCFLKALNRNGSRIGNNWWEAKKLEILKGFSMKASRLTSKTEMNSSPWFGAG